MNKNLDRLREILVRSWPDVPPSLPADRGRLVTAVEMALAQRARRVVVQRRAFQVGFASAAALLLVASSWKVSEYVDARRMASAERARAQVSEVPGSDSLRILQAPDVDSTGGAIVTKTSAAGDTRYVAAEGTLLEPGQTLDASTTAELRVGSVRGTSLTLEPAAELAINSLGKTQRFTLAQGSVRTRVAKLRVDERFILGTTDAEIEVHGTAFRVSLVNADARCGDGVRTRVAVTEGVVSVRSRGIESFLGVGEEWPRGCSAAASAAMNPPAAPSAALATRETKTYESAQHHRGPLHRLAHHRRRALALSAARAREAAVAVDASSVRSPATSSSSSLAAQNDLFAAAARAKKEGRFSESVRLFSDLVDRYPDGPLLESAMVQRIRAMRDSNPAGLSDAVAEYLARFPSGFARAEARRLSSNVQ
jgi:FecR protein